MYVTHLSYKINHLLTKIAVSLQSEGEKMAQIKKVTEKS